MEELCLFSFRLTTQRVFLPVEDGTADLLSCGCIHIGHRLQKFGKKAVHGGVCSAVSVRSKSKLSRQRRGNRKLAKKSDDLCSYRLKGSKRKSLCRYLVFIITIPSSLTVVPPSRVVVTFSFYKCFNSSQ